MEPEVEVTVDAINVATESHAAEVQSEPASSSDPASSLSPIMEPEANADSTDLTGSSVPSGDVDELNVSSLSTSLVGSSDADANSIRIVIAPKPTSPNGADVGLLSTLDLADSPEAHSNPGSPGTVRIHGSPGAEPEDTKAASTTQEDKKDGFVGSVISLASLVKAAFTTESKSSDDEEEPTVGCQCGCRDRITRRLEDNKLLLILWISICALAAPFIERLVAFAQIGASEDGDAAPTNGLWLLAASVGGGFLGSLLFYRVLASVNRRNRPYYMMATMFWTLVLQAAASIVTFSYQILLFVASLLPASLLDSLIMTYTEGRGNSAVCNFTTSSGLQVG